MIVPVIEWKPSPTKYGAGGSIAYVERYPVAETVRATGRRDAVNEKLWYGIIRLPGIGVKPDLNHFADEAGAREVVETVIKTWFKRIAPALTIIHEPQKSED